MGLPEIAIAEMSHLEANSGEGSRRFIVPGNRTHELFGGLRRIRPVLPGTEESHQSPADLPLAFKIA